MKLSLSATKSKGAQAVSVPAAKTSISAAGPSILTFIDYHQIPQRQDKGRKTNPKFRCVELSPDDYRYEYTEKKGLMYYGLAYLAGEKPTEKTIRSMLAKKLAGTGYKKIAVSATATATTKSLSKAKSARQEFLSALMKRISGDAGDGLSQAYKEGRTKEFGKLLDQVRKQMVDDMTSKGK